MIKIFEALPFWLKKPGSEIEKLCAAFQTFFERIESRLLQPLEEMDPKICSRLALEYHSWERSIKRVQGEPIETWRNRVDSALETYQQAGSTRGLKVILQMHGAKDMLVEERMPGEDWDIIRISIDPDELSIDANVLLEILAIWGRLCRRYEVAMNMKIDFPFTIAANEQTENCETIDNLTAEIGPEDLIEEWSVSGINETITIEAINKLDYEASENIQDALFLMSGHVEYNMLETITN